MKKENIASVRQLMEAMKESVSELEKAKKENNSTKVAGIRKEILRFQKKIEGLL